MLEEAERREAENKALAALDELYEKHGDAMVRLAEIEKEQWEQDQRGNRILERYNYFYNTEVSGLTWGTPITAEFQQAMALECMLDALRHENLIHGGNKRLNMELSRRSIVMHFFKQSCCEHSFQQIHWIYRNSRLLQ
jgi:hypothetical protein